jgi:DNA topoisomerase-1
VQVLNGKYGPYITDGEKNGKIPKDRDPKTLTLEECEAILAAAPPRPVRGRFGRAAKKAAPAKKSAAKKSTAKKVLDPDNPPARKPMNKTAKKAAKKSVKQAAATPAAKQVAAKKIPAKKAVKKSAIVAPAPVEAVPKAPFVPKRGLVKAVR